MPVINMPVDLLLRLVNAGRTVLDESRLGQTLHDMGIEVDEVTTTRVYACAACENVLERTQAQGEPQACPRCGADFRAAPASLRPLGDNKVARLDMLAVRPDLFDPGGMARAMRGFLGVRTGLVEYPIAEARLRVRVDPRLSRDESYRPCIACAVLRNVRLDNERIKALMNLQEDLHWALGRDRKLASIGVYDLETLSERGPFSYRAVEPDELRFVPLGLSPADPAAQLTPRQILQRHKTGLAYAHLLKGCSAYPLLTDGQGAVLSMPPIINSEATRVTMRTRQCFVDVTGLAQRTVDRALNILAGGLKEVMPELSIEAVTIEYADRTIVTPDFTPAELSLDVRTAAETVGVELTAAELARLLERMGHAVALGGAQRPGFRRGAAAQGDRPEADPPGVGGLESGPPRENLHVRVPAWRNDVMHPVDLIEDAAIAFGYENLAARLVPTFTIGTPRAIEEQSTVARRVMTGLGFHQVMTLTLTSEPAAQTRWRLPADPRAVKIENPISSEQTHCRVSLLPGLLETLSINKQYDLPQHLFEVGDCCFVEADAETGARDERMLAAAMIGTHVGYADIRAVVDALVHETCSDVRFVATEHPSFIPGRVAAICDSRGAQLGVVGEIHPEVIEAYGLRHAVAVAEVSLARLLGGA